MKCKTITTLLIITVFAVRAYAQAPIWKETFKQKKTQREYFAKQIALLQTYIGYVKKGYDIASAGWTTIEHIRNGEVSLHRDFFSSLKNVNPHITSTVKVVDIIAFQVFIASEMRRTYNYCRTNGHFTAKERLYVYNVYHNMVFLTDANLSELIRITTHGQTEMKDADRLASIDELYSDSLDKIAFARSFSNDTKRLGAVRQNESFQNSVMKTQYGI